MPRKALTADWSIDLDPSFQGRVVDDELQLMSPGPPRRTIWFAAWQPPQEESVESLLAKVREQSNPTPMQRFEESTPDEGRFAAWYPEEDQWGLYSYTVRQGSCVQAAFFGDAPEELTWALTAWRSLQYRVAGQRP